MTCRMSIMTLSRLFAQVRLRDRPRPTLHQRHSGPRNASGSGNHVGSKNGDLRTSAKGRKTRGRGQLDKQNKQKWENKSASRQQGERQCLHQAKKNRPNQTKRKPNNNQGKRNSEKKARRKVTCKQKRRQQTICGMHAMRHTSITTGVRR